METITINIDKRTKELFRETVRKEYGLNKGQLGKAVNEALLKWIEEKEQRLLARELSSLMKKGFDMGKIKYKSRSELYER